MDITGSLNVVRFINYGGNANTLALFAALGPNVTAIGRTTGMHYVSQGQTVAVSRTLPPGAIPDTVKVPLPFDVLTPTNVPGMIEPTYPEGGVTLVVKVIALVVESLIG